MVISRAAKGIAIALVIAVSIVFGLVLTLNLTKSDVRDAFCGGSGTHEEPWLICSAEALTTIGADRKLLADSYLVTKDIDFSEHEEQMFHPIGGRGLPFSGTFDGDGHTIENLLIRRSEDEFVGLFGWVGADGHVMGIHLERADVRAKISVGSLVGYNEGIVENVSFSGIVEGHSAVGGLVGQSDGPIRDVESSAVVVGQDLVGGVVGITRADIRDSSFWGNVSGRAAVGGLVGAQMAGEIINCRVSGDAQGDFQVEGVQTVGGLVGSLAGEEGDVAIIDSFAAIDVIGTEEATGGLAGLASGPVTGSHATGNVEGDTAVGGLVGVAGSRISTSYATGDVTGDMGVGGLIGTSGATVTDVHATGDVSGRTDVGGLVARNEGHITNAFALGFVHGESHVSGLVGHNLGEIAHSYWNVDAGMEASEGDGTPLSLEEFADSDNFPNFRFCPADDCRWTMSEPLEFPVLSTSDIP